MNGGKGTKQWAESTFIGKFPYLQLAGHESNLNVEQREEGDPNYLRLNRNMGSGYW
jgi:hypothetical protein